MTRNTYLSLFLEAADLPADLRRTEDNRALSAPPDDDAFPRCRGEHWGLAVWQGRDSAAVWRFVDMRWLFGSAGGASAWYRSRLDVNREFQPLLASAPAVGDECHVFGGTFLDPLTGTISITSYLYVVRVGRVVAKLYAAEGDRIAPQSKRLTVESLAPLAERAAQRATNAAERGDGVPRWRAFFSRG